MQAVDNIYSSSEDSVPELEEVTQGVTEGTAAGASGIPEEPASKAKQSKGEKKARKTMSTLGLKLVPGVSRVLIKRSKNIHLVIKNPDVYRNHANDTYILFGQGTVEDLAQQAQLAALEKFKTQETNPVEAEVHPSALAPIAEESEGEEEVDGTGVDDNDIELVMSQANVSRAKAIKALKNNKNDIVNAIMELTI